MVRSKMHAVARLLRALGLLTIALCGVTVGAVGVSSSDVSPVNAESGCILQLTQARWLAPQGSTSAQIHVTWQWSPPSAADATVRILVTNDTNPDPATNSTLDPRAIPLSNDAGETLNRYPTTAHNATLVVSQPSGPCDGAHSDHIPVTFATAAPAPSTMDVLPTESASASNPELPKTSAGTTATSSNSAAGGTCVGPVCAPTLPDPGQALSDAVASGITMLLASAVNWLTGLLQSVISWATAGSTCTSAEGDTSTFTLLSSTPPCLSYANSYVQTYAALCRNIALCFVALLICLHGLEIALSTRAARTFDGSLDAMRRIALAAVLGSVVVGSNGGNGLFGAVITLANAMTAAVGSGTLPTPPSTGPGVPLQDALIALLFLAMELILIVQLLLRLALLDLLLVISPLAVLCYAYPRWTHWATHWAQLTAATVLLQFLQVTALQVSENMVVGLDVSSASTASATVLQTLLGIAGLVMVVRLPKLLYGLGSVLNGGLPFALGGSGSSADESTAPSSDGGTTTVSEDDAPPRLTAGHVGGLPLPLPPATGTQGGPSAGGGSGGPLHPGGGSLGAQTGLVPSSGSSSQGVSPAFGDAGGRGSVVITEVPPAQLKPGAPQLDGPQARLLPSGGSADAMPPPGGWP